MSDHQPHDRRIDRVLEPSFAEGLSELALEELRTRRDDALAEREYLSMLRRLLQGRAEILRAELDARVSDGSTTPLVDRLTEILAADEHSVSSRGEYVRIEVPEEEMLLARRRVERLANDAGISDPTELGDQELAAAIETLAAEEAGVSGSRRQVIAVLDRLQDELKRRYKEDPTLALR